MPPAVAAGDVPPPANASPPRVSSDDRRADALSDRERIDLETRLEQKALAVFATAVTYAGRGQVHLDLQ
jgi:hypothetical protein